MNVSEYIEELKKLPQDLPVMRFEGEDGYGPVDQGPALKEVEENPNRRRRHWQGRYLDAANGEQVVVL